MQVDFTHLA
jgi:DNA replication licensing factor MCM6